MTSYYDISGVNVRFNDGEGNVVLTPDNIHADIPFDYWKVGNPVYPLETAKRRNEFQLFRDLYDGVMHQVLPQPPSYYGIRENYFKTFAEFLPAALMSMPPTANVDKRVLATLNKNLRRSLVDYLRYGTSIMGIYFSEEGYGINVFDPRFFYTHGFGSYTYLSFSQGVMYEDKWIAGQYFWNVWTTENGMLKEKVGDTIDGGTYDRLPIIFVPRGEPRGIWGESLYFNMYQENISLIKRMSGLDDVFEIFEKPRLYLSGISTDELQYKFTVDEKTNQIINSRNDYAVEAGKEIATSASSVDYKSPTRFDQATQDFLDRLIQQMHVQTGVPQAIFGYYKGDAASKVTGETMREANKAMKYTCADIINIFKPELEYLLQFTNPTEEVILNWLDDNEGNNNGTDPIRDN